MFKIVFGLVRVRTLSRLPRLINFHPPSFIIIPRIIAGGDYWREGDYSRETII